MINKERMSKEQLKIVMGQAKEALQRVKGGDSQDVSAMYDVLRYAQAGFYEVTTND